jgi:hypothetical protein
MAFESAMGMLSLTNDRPPEVVMQLKALIPTRQLSWLVLQFFEHFNEPMALDGNVKNQSKPELFLTLLND